VCPKPLARRTTRALPLRPLCLRHIYALPAGVTLSLQSLQVFNVLANFTTLNSTNSSSAAGSWSLSLTSIAQAPGSLLRVLQSKLALADCSTAQRLYDAAGSASPTPGLNVTQVRPSPAPRPRCTLKALIDL
jgi:hypothetical protein